MNDRLSQLFKRGILFIISTTEFSIHHPRYMSKKRLKLTADGTFLLAELLAAFLCLLLATVLAVLMAVLLAWLDDAPEAKLAT